jgi:hypothetical protein
MADTPVEIMAAAEELERKRWRTSVPLHTSDFLLIERQTDTGCWVQYGPPLLAGAARRELDRLSHLYGMRAAVRALAGAHKIWPLAVNEVVSDALIMFKEAGGCSNDVPVAFLLATAAEGEDKGNG